MIFDNRPSFHIPSTVAVDWFPHLTLCNCWKLSYKESTGALLDGPANFAVQDQPGQ